ncbi:hypothetical protein NQP46_24080 [Streptomyces albus]|nr:hypothetical protein NQP46_24080 [Streptomyces albus]
MTQPIPHHVLYELGCTEGSPATLRLLARDQDRRGSCCCAPSWTPPTRPATSVARPPPGAASRRAGTC